MSKKHINLIDYAEKPITFETIQQSAINIGKNTIDGFYKTINLNTAINVVKTYKFGGTAQAGMVAVGSFLDGALASNDVTAKNYISLTSFWGSVAWKAASQIEFSDKIPSSLKNPLKIASGLVGAGMIYWGPDVFASKNTNTLGSLKLMASFFDKNANISSLEEKFKEGYITGFTHAIKNFKQLLSNKFIINTLKIQGLDIAKLIIVQKFFQYLPTGKIAALFATKKESWTNYLIKIGIMKFVKEVIEIIHDKQTSGLKESIKKDIQKQVGELALKENNTQTVIELGTKVNNLPSNIESINNKVTQEISAKFNNVVTPFVFPQMQAKDGSSDKILDTNAPLFLLESLINTIFTKSTQLVTYLNKFYNKEKKDESDEHSESTTQPMGCFTLTTMLTPAHYTYTNIQEIAKLGGNKFMLNKLMRFIEKESASQAGSNSSTERLLNILKSFVEEFLYAGLFKTQGISQEKLFSIEQDINILKNALGLNSGMVQLSSQEIKPEEIESTLKKLKEENKSGPQRKLNDKMVLSVKDYHLKKKSENKDMIIMEELAFESGKVCAITGKVGTGKTTVLTDIAKCLASAFSSEGEISYPKFADKECELIFCGTIPFSPPATTLLERLTYRIPTEYIEPNEVALLDQAVELFVGFGQKGFTKEKLLKKGNDTKLDLSTGQSKLVMLISAILYKQYLNKPVLFVMDETLANLDEETTTLICSKIKKVFEDSIVICVDHGAKNNTDFYDNYVDLAHYVIPDDLGTSEVQLHGKDEVIFEDN